MQWNSTNVWTEDVDWDQDRVHSVTRWSLSGSCSWWAERLTTVDSAHVDNRVRPEIDGEHCEVQHTDLCSSDRSSENSNRQFSGASIKTALTDRDLFKEFNAEKREAPGSVEGNSILNKETLFARYRGKKGNHRFSPDADAESVSPRWLWSIPCLTSVDGWGAENQQWRWKRWRWSRWEWSSTSERRADDTSHEETRGIQEWHSGIERSAKKYSLAMHQSN